VLGLLDLDIRPVHFADDLGGRLVGPGDRLRELRAVDVARILIEEAVQEGDVARVDAALDALQPVAFPEALEGEVYSSGASKQS